MYTVFILHSEVYVLENTVSLPPHTLREILTYVMLGEKIRRKMGKR
jgi:hypothetical protein